MNKKDPCFFIHNDTQILLVTIVICILSCCNSLSAQELTLPTYHISIEQQYLDALNRNPYSNEKYPALFIAGDNEYEVEVRYRGGSTRNLPKKSWKIYFDDDKFEEESVINLNAEYNDFSLSRNYLCFALARHFDLTAPETSFISLIVNGAYCGVYHRIEDINTDFFERRELGDGEIFKPENHNARFSPPTDYEVLASAYSVKDADDEQKALDSLAAKISLLRYTFPIGSGDIFENMFDTENLCKHWALEYVIGNNDGFTKNYYLHLNSDGKYMLVPWDCDATLGNNWQGVFYGGAQVLEFGFLEQQAIFSWLISSPDNQDRLLHYIDAMSTEGFEYISELSETVFNTISHDALLDTAKKSSNEQFINEFPRIRNLVNSRSGYLRNLDRFHYTPVIRHELTPAYLESLDDIIHSEVLTQDDVYQIFLQIVDSSNTHVRLELNDDGENGDANAGDGIYSLDFNLCNFNAPFKYCYWIRLGETEGYPYPPAGWTNAHAAPLSLPIIQHNVNQPSVGSIAINKVEMEKCSDTFIISLTNVSDIPVNMSGCYIQLGESARKVQFRMLEDLAPDSSIYLTNHIDRGQQIMAGKPVAGKFYFMPSVNDTLIVKDAADRTVAQRTIDEFDDIDEIVGCVVINEINYNSPDGFESGDWIELTPSGGMVDISRWSIRDENDEHVFVFPDSIMLRHGELIIVAESLESFHDQHPEVSNVIGGFDFGFSGSGDEIRLFDRQGFLVDWVNYSDGEPWPTEADGDGATLELVHPSLLNYNHVNWQASRQHLGTPGAENSVFGIDETDLPEDFTLYAPYPNPFNSQTVIKYDLPAEEDVSIQIYNLNGRMIAQLQNGLQSAGKHQIIWNAEMMPNGVYFMNLSVNGKCNTMKMVLLK